MKMLALHFTHESHVFAPYDWEKQVSDRAMIACIAQSDKETTVILEYEDKCGHYP